MARGLLLWRSCLLSCLLSAWVSTAQPVEAPSGTPAATVLNGPAVAPAISPAAAAEGGADVVYIRSEALWNVTNLSGTFSSAVQTNFTTALRQLLEPEQFMSIALTSITAQQPAGSYMVDSSLVVGAPIAQASASFEQVAYESIINKTLGPDFKQLLAAQGVNCDVQLNKLTGKTEAASTAIPLVNVVTNVTVTGVDISQLLSQALAPNATGPSITTPLQQQIQVDPAQNVSITPTGVSGQNQLGLTINTTFDQANLPDYWSLLLNYSSYSPPINGQQLNFTLNGNPVVTQAGTRNASATTPGAAPAPSPAASSSTTGININIYMAGGGILPFTTSKQTDATSALAAVFSILIGTGSVSLSRFDLANGASSAATAGARRRLLQAGVDTTFAATIPTATSNSLLVLQSQSPQVRNQFGGWFTSQMVARGYTGLSATIENVTLTGAAAPASGPVGTAALPGNSASPAAGHSSNHVGAIVGGVVGGVIALVLIAGALAFFIWREARRQRAKAVNKSLVAAKLGDDSSSVDERMNSTDVKEAMRGVTLDRLLMGGSDMSTPSRSETASATSRDEVKSLLVRSHHRKVSSRVVSRHHNFENEAALIAIARLAPGTEFQGLYQMDTGGSRGANSLVCFAHNIREPEERVAIKFHPDQERFLHENRFYENRVALEAETAADHIPAYLGSYNTTSSSNSTDDSTASLVPPCIILERGEYTLRERMGSLSAAPVAEALVTQERVRILFDLCKAVEYLHARSLVHRAIQPANFLWCPMASRWKLLDFTTWARTGDVVPLLYSLRYAAPELLAADLAGESSVKAEEAADVWSLGLVCFELFRGRPLFGDETADDHVIAMLLGYLPFPWESDTTFFSQQLPQPVANFVLDLLHRNPACRKPIRTIVHSHVFGSFDFNIASSYSNISELMSKDF
ncbi:hypothetical protein WJX74_005338 [Apatococcus lobatus]|uniref:Protein kinase domain-containing protein n=1 Tax=Apatococcus lobatus TaxID=904363 RepID=A0AAW1S5A0_9CHLO